MNYKNVWRVVAVLVLLAGIAGLGALAFNAGVERGYVMAAQTAGAEGTKEIVPWMGMPYMGHFYRPHFFNPFGFLFGLFLFFLVIGAARRLLWGGHRMHRPWMHHPGEHGAPPFFDEWHRQAHAKPEETQPPQA